VIIELADMKAHLNLTTDADDTLLTGKIDAAEDFVRAFIGSDGLAAEFPDGVPGAILESVRQIAAHLYENREASVVGVSASELPFGALDLLAPYRRWVF
jgi:hypothetical protein